MISRTPDTRVAKLVKADVLVPLEVMDNCESLKTSDFTNDSQDGSPIADDAASKSPTTVVGDILSGYTHRTH